MVLGAIKYNCGFPISRQLVASLTEFLFFEDFSLRKASCVVVRLSEKWENILNNIMKN